MKLTPVLIVEEIEPSLPFWVERMGFQLVAEVPHNDKVGFVILARDNAELMLQTVESVKADAAVLAPRTLDANTTLFVEVDDFEETVQRLSGFPVAMAERTTFYGMREIGVRAPSGHVVIFAAKT